MTVSALLPRLRAAPLFALCLVLASCASPALHDADQLALEGHHEQALAVLDAARAHDPADRALQAARQRQLELTISVLANQAAMACGCASLHAGRAASLGGSGQSTAGAPVAAAGAVDVRDVGRAAVAATGPIAASSSCTAAHTVAASVAAAANARRRVRAGAVIATDPAPRRCRGACRTTTSGRPRRRWHWPTRAAAGGGPG